MALYSKKSISEHNMFYTYVCMVNDHNTDENRPPHDGYSYADDEVEADDKEEPIRVEKSKALYELVKTQKDQNVQFHTNVGSISNAGHCQTTALKYGDETTDEEQVNPNVLKLTKMKWLSEGNNGSPDSSVTSLSVTSIELEATEDSDDEVDARSAANIDRHLSTILKLDKEQNMFGLSSRFTKTSARPMKKAHKNDRPVFHQTQIVQHSGLSTTTLSETSLGVKNSQDKTGNVLTEDAADMDKHLSTVIKLDKEHNLFGISSHFANTLETLPKKRRMNDKPVLYRTQITQDSGSSATTSSDTSIENNDSQDMTDDAFDGAKYTDKHLSTVLELDKEHNLFGLSSHLCNFAKPVKKVRVDTKPVFQQTQIVQVCCASGCCKDKSNTGMPCILGCGTCTGCCYSGSLACAVKKPRMTSSIIFAGRSRRRPCCRPVRRRKSSCRKLGRKKSKQLRCTDSCCLGPGFTCGPDSCCSPFGMRVYVQRKPKPELAPIEITPTTSSILQKPNISRPCPHCPRCMPPSSCFPFMMPCFWPSRPSAPCSHPNQCFHNPPCPPLKCPTIPKEYLCSSMDDPNAQDECTFNTCLSKNPRIQDEAEYFARQAKRKLDQGKCRGSGKHYKPPGSTSGSPNKSDSDSKSNKAKTKTATQATAQAASQAAQAAKQDVEQKSKPPN